MNYAIVYLAGILGFALVYWFIQGRKFYTGPLIEAEVQLDSDDGRDPPNYKESKEANGSDGSDHV
jgi:hypothetical protein